MEFRPCIDIHNGKVKQIVGGSLKDEGNQAKENFVAEQDAAYFAEFYKKDKIRGGHIILLNPSDSSYYKETKRQALLALRTASHVIVTSYVFKDGKVNYNNLEKILAAVGKEHLVLDLSCRKKDGDYYIVTDRWQKFTEEKITPDLLDKLKEYADEFLVHAVDVEGKASGIEVPLAEMLGDWGRIPITYAGGVGSFEDLKQLKEHGKGRLNVTIGSALDLFGGRMAYKEVLQYINQV